MSHVTFTESIRANNVAGYRRIPVESASSRYQIREVDGSDGAIWLEIESLHDLIFWRDAPPIDPDHGHWWIARLGKKAVGFAGLIESQHCPGMGYLSRVGVLPTHRGHGLQRRFMRALEACAKRNGWSGIVADTRDALSANNFARGGYRIFEPGRRWAFLDSIYWSKEFRKRSRRAKQAKARRKRKVRQAVAKKAAVKKAVVKRGKKPSASSRKPSTRRRQNPRGASRKRRN
jgi:GNAT superfamily N-acetyltransferase